MRRILDIIEDAIYPGSLSSLVFIELLVLGAYCMRNDLSLDIIDKIQCSLQTQQFCPQALPIVSCAFFGFGLWLAIILALKYTLKALYQYQGWLKETGPKGPSIKTKLWAIMVKLLTLRKKKLFSLQGVLPRLTVPSIEDTLKRYLKSVRPLLDDKKFEQVEELAKEFEATVAPRLQRYVVFKSWWCNNYVSDWWEEYVYLRNRAALMANSNFYGVDLMFVQPTHLPAARAANMIVASLTFRRMLDDEKVQPVMLQGLVPLCAWQYRRIFNTTRIPGIDKDHINHLSGSDHIVVYHKGCYYKVMISYKGRIYNAPEVESQIQMIIDDTVSQPDIGEQHVGALTATDRQTWAKARLEYFARGVNKKSLDVIEKAAFMVVIDDEEYGYDHDTPERLNTFTRAALHGKGYDRWYDKNFNLIFSKNARVCFNAEHSWADAGTFVHLWEDILFDELHYVRYKEDGHCIGRIEVEPPAPTRLKWDFSDECLSVIESSLSSAKLLISNVDLEILMHADYGKAFIKTCKISPDAFIQMALQLAYYRDVGKFCLTYEANTMRLFREGRTEAVRPCTLQSCAWVKSMESKSTNKNKESIQLLREACDTHQKAYQDAMLGKAIDRHLFCLYVVSKYLKVDSPFLKEYIGEPWRLSTSQTPQGQTQSLHLFKHVNHSSAGGGFGPVSEDGYGVSYIVAGENMLFFHIASKRSSDETDSKRFARNIEGALADMKSLFMEFSSSSNGASGEKKVHTFISKQVNGCK